MNDKGVYNFFWLRKWQTLEFFQLEILWLGNLYTTGFPNILLKIFLFSYKRSEFCFVFYAKDVIIALFHRPG